MNLATARGIHDTLLANKPEGVEHDTAICEFCTSPAIIETASTEAVVKKVREEEPRMEPIHTQEATDALIESAVAKALAEAKAKHDEQVATLTSSLDEATAKVDELQVARDADQIAIAAKDAKVAELEGEIASREEAAAKAVRQDERLAEVAKVATFSDEYVEANKERWAEMAEDAFASWVDGMRDLAAQIKPAETKEDVVPEETAMNNERSETPPVPGRVSFFDSLKGGSK